MSNKAVVSLTTGSRTRTSHRAFLSRSAPPSPAATMMFLTKEAVRLATEGVATGTACEGCPPITDLMARYLAAAASTWCARSASTPSTSTRPR